MHRLSFLIVVVACMAGCGPQNAKSATQTSEQDYQLAREAFERKDYLEAARLVDGALGRGGLNADLAADAIMIRAKANIQLGKLSEALKDLEEARNGPVLREEIFAAKGDIAILQGDLAEARRLYEKAQKANPAIKWPEKLSK